MHLALVSARGLIVSRQQRTHPQSTISASFFVKKKKSLECLLDLVHVQVHVFDAAKVGASHAMVLRWIWVLF